jgi:2-hydroxy-6-oxonona-2,4-dienedioate hydrolase
MTCAHADFPEIFMTDTPARADAPTASSGPRNMSIWSALFRTPHKLAWIDADGVSTRYLEAGDPAAPTVLMLHGTAGSLENFCANIDAFSRQFRVIAIDMLGCGFTDKPAYDYAILDYGKHALAVLDALGVDKASVVGVSLGSWVAAAMAEAWPERIESVVMVAPAGIIADAEADRKTAEKMRQRRMAAAEAPSWESVSKALSGLVLDPARLSDDIIAVRLAAYSQPEMMTAMPHLLAFAADTQAGALTEDRWRALAQPILVVLSVDAPNMFLLNGRRILELAPNARAVEISDCDHWTQYEQPDRFNAAAIEFLSETADV